MEGNLSGGDDANVKISVRHKRFTTSLSPVKESLVNPTTASVDKKALQEKEREV